MARLTWRTVFAFILVLVVASAGAAQEPEQKAEESEKAEPGAEKLVKKVNASLDAAKAERKPPGVLRSLGKSAGNNSQRRQVEAISTDTMMRLGDLARAQEATCRAMQAGADKAQENQPRAEMVAQLSEAMRGLLEQTLTPLWSGLSVKALRAGRFDFASIHARFEAAMRAQERAREACRGKPHAGGADAEALAGVDLRKQYEAAFEAGVVHALSQHKRLEHADKDLELALRGLPPERRAALEPAMQAAITEAVQK